MTLKSHLKPFEPMLASPRGRLIFPCIVQPKYDGIRCVVRNGVAMSRNLEPIRNKLICETLSSPQFEGLDGELILGDPCDPDVYNKTQSVVMEAAADPSGVVYYVFDDFTDPRLPYVSRYHNSVKRVIELGPESPVYTVPYRWCEDEADLTDMSDPLFDMGFEGAMVRDPAGLYKYGRATEKEGSLWKIKRMQDDEMLVIRVEERMHNENEATVDARGKTKRSKAQAGLVGTGMLGVLVGINDKQWPGEEIKVGSSNLPKMTLAEAQRHFCGKLVTFKHQPAGAKDAPRFPIYKGVRDAADLSRFDRG